MTAASKIILKGNPTTRDSTLIFWYNSNNAVKVSLYHKAVKSHCIVVATHAYTYEFQLPIITFA